MNFSVYWQHADAVSKTLYFVLLAMSIATWTIFILRLMGTRQLKQHAYAQLAQALDKLKAKLSPLNFDQRKAVTEQALLRQIALEKASAEKGVSVLGTIAYLRHLWVYLAQCGGFSMHLLLWGKVVKQVLHKWRRLSVKL